ncbi:MAG: rod shape-determining protein MreD [Lysobacteraceae bacterium]|nr:MAG: rod shape-determining protein MreD [Xanthomonadaceae bacterium]
MTRTPSSWLVYGSLLASLLVLVVPLPAGVNVARPYLLAMLLCYWMLEAPDRVGLGVAFIAGLAADLVSGTLLGEQALRLVVLAFLVQRFRARLRFFPLWQQALAVFVLLLNDRLIAQAIRLASGDGLAPWGTWISPLVGLALWPWLFLMLDELRLRLRERERGA